MLPVLFPPDLPELPDAHTLLSTLAEEEVHCEMCGHGLDLAPMLDCERCHKWFHGDCVGYVVLIFIAF